MAATVTFCGLELETWPGVYEPQPSSENLVLAALMCLQPLGPTPSLVADICTGGGAIALAIAAHHRSAIVMGADSSRVAIDLANRNAERLGLRVVFDSGDLFKPLPGAYGQLAVVTANPPHLRRRELEADRRATDPVKVPIEAYGDGSIDGLDLMRRLAAQALEWLAPYGVLLVEMGHDRVKAVRKVLHDAGFATEAIAAGRPTCVISAVRRKGWS